jgi:hypothetical protein
VTSLDTSLSRGLATIRALGFGTAVLYLLSRAFNRYCSFISVGEYYIVARPTSSKRLLSEIRDKSILVLQITQDHPHIDALPRKRDEIARRFAGGAVCFLATRENRVTGHLWVTLSPYREPFHRCEFSPQPPGRSAWDFDMWIAPEERLGFTFARLWDECNSYLLAKNVNWTYSCVSAFNLSAIRAHQRMGMRKMHKLVFWAVGPVELMLANVAPYVALSLSRSTFPLIKVSALTEAAST